MVVKKKSKIAKTKKNNQKRNKLIKQGVIKKGAKKDKRENVVLPPQNKKTAEEEDYESEDDAEDMLQMVDEDDIDFMKNAIAQRSYSILNKVRYAGPKTKKRKTNNENDTLESNYEEQIEDNSSTKIKSLLPIKTKSGLIPQQIVEQIEDEIDDPQEQQDENGQVEDETEEMEEEADYILESNEIDLSKPISAAQLIVARNEILRQRKIHIGTLSSGLLENPEEKVTNFRTLLNLMEEQTPEVYFSVRKLVIISLLEIFKDLLPSYEIKNVVPDGVKLKKDTLKLHKFEENLLQYYKKFLQKLEKHCLQLVKKKGNTQKLSEEEKKLCELSVKAMCDLLVAHPDFNYAQNIAQVVVPFLNSSNSEVREMAKNAIKTIFKEDRKEEITLKVLRILNHYLKTHTHNVNKDMLEVLLVLNLRDVNLDQDKEEDIKEKKMNARKQKLLQMSKKERKRKKKLQELEKELLETKAEENKKVKHHNLTEITKIVFNIYFRILKGSSNPKVLGVCLEGLAKFASCINLEYYVDIVNVLNNLLKEDWLGYREKLHCIQTIFIMLRGQGEVLNLDPTRFYNCLYRDLLQTNASNDHEDIALVLDVLNEALIKRRRKITNKRTIGFVKRLATLSLQLLHNGALGTLCTVRTVMQLNRAVDILLDLDSSVGDGKFDAEIDDPEYANASTSAIYETTLLTRHYHPIVKKYGRYIASGGPVSGEGSLPTEYAKMTSEELCTDFSMAEMAFNPSVPAPKKTTPKSRPKPLLFADEDFERECKDILKTPQKRKSFWIEM